MNTALPVEVIEKRTESKGTMFHGQFLNSHGTRAIGTYSDTGFGVVAIIQGQFDFTQGNGH